MSNQLTKKEELEKTIKSFKTLGIVIIVIGILALVYPNGIGDVSAISIGGVMILGGHFRMTLAVVAKSMGSVVLKFLFGLLMIFSGTGFIGNPDMGLTTITLAMAIYLVVDGLIASIYGFTLLSIGKGKFILASGVVSMIFAVFVYTTWPQSGLYILGMFIGTKLIVDGVAFYLTGNMISKASA